jgi:hypothetical protein
MRTALTTVETSAQTIFVAGTRTSPTSRIHIVLIRSLASADSRFSSLDGNSHPEPLMTACCSGGPSA